ncbi:MAG: septum formation initiator family protein [Alphaproteobacteria bacterium]
MAVLHEIRSRVRQAVAPVLGALLIGYFSYHLVQGNHGLIAYTKLKANIAIAKDRRAELQAERGRIEARVRLLRPDNLDPDMLEERARAMLNVAHPEEIIILRDARDRLSTGALPLR